MSAYIPPSATSADLYFNTIYTSPVLFDIYIGIEGLSLNQVLTDGTYVYIANSNGLDIYDVVSENLCAYVSYFSGFSSVWENTDRLFLGTFDSGIKYILKSSISGGMNISAYLCDFSDYYGHLTSDVVNYIHGNDRTLMAVTTSGVDVVKYGYQGYHSFTTITGGTKCFITSQSKGYYIVNQGDEWSLNRINTCLGDWTVPSKVYITGSGVFEYGLALNDLFVTEFTSSNGIDNCLFVATSSGVYVIDEGASYYIVTNLSGNVNSIYADINTSWNSGKLYIGLQDCFSVVDLENQTLYDKYTTTIKGRTNELLEDTDVVDIVVGA